MVRTADASNLHATRCLDAISHPNHLVTLFSERAALEGWFVVHPVSIDFMTGFRNVLNQIRIELGRDPQHAEGNVDIDLGQHIEEVRHRDACQPVVTDVALRFNVLHIDAKLVGEGVTVPVHVTPPPLHLRRQAPSGYRIRVLLCRPE